MKATFLIFLISLIACKDKSQNSSALLVINDLISPENIEINQGLLDNTIKTRFSTPVNFERTIEGVNSFEQYLRNLNLKPKDSNVLYYNGSVKFNNNVYCGVVDLGIGSKDLHQCADAVMRLKAEYHWVNKEYGKIHFKFTNGFNVEYKEWMKGRRMVVEGNKTSWSNRDMPSTEYDDFWDYLELIFMYAGTASLEKELQSINSDEPKIGDVIIQGGYPGHAVIIVDKAQSTMTNKSIYLLAQSFMPAQEIQVLVNQNDKSINPWYKLDQEIIETPEWRFNRTDIMRFAK